MANDFLDPKTDPEDLVFKDFPKREKPREDDDYFGEECSRCKGRGGWNLKVDCYPNSIPAYRHFRASCPSCNGYGYFVKGQTCAHEWRTATREETDKAGISLWRCEHHWKCIHCGKDRVVDSSD